MKARPASIAAGCRLCTGALALLPLLCHAERPMVVDDAGTLDKGRYKVEAGWSKDGAERSREAAAGFAPMHDVEFEINHARAHEHATIPSIRFEGRGLAAKWVPFHGTNGWSAGLKLAYGHTDMRQDGHATTPMHARAVSGLATWRSESGHAAHLNVGRQWLRSGGADARESAWGIGLEQPIGQTLRLTLEMFGVAGERPGRQAGLRWTVAEGVKLSAAVGRDGGRPTANAGIALEF